VSDRDPSTARVGRLHPTSILFLLASSTRQLIGPLIAAAVFSRGLSNLFWVPIALGAILVTAIVRYVTVRYRLGDADLTVRGGILFRTERHVPYARIQNVNLIRNPLHRWLGVAEVHVETAGGSKPEAILRVLSIEAVDELRRHVFEGRGEVGAVAADGTPAAVADGGHDLVRMTPRDVALFGFLSNRGMVLVAAALGALSQLIPDDGGWAEGLEETVKEAVAGGVAAASLPRLPGPVVSVALAVVALIAILILLRLLSVAWGFLKFHGFRLREVGDDLRSEYGLFTRITATVPRRRVQLFHVREGWMQRRLGVASVQVETAGGVGNDGDGGEKGVSHLWLAPLVASERVEALRSVVLPGVDLDGADWRPPAPSTRARLTRRYLLVALAIPAIAAPALRWWALAVALVTIVVAVQAARLYVRHTRWTEVDGAVAFRSGWWVRRTSIVPFTKMQTVTLARSPFDRRRGTARVRVDTAGAGRVGHGVDVRYVEAEAARDLHAMLSRHAAETAFRW
jgi:putative membrane protein